MWIYSIQPPNDKYVGLAPRGLNYLGKVCYIKRRHIMGAFHLRRLACNVAGKLGNAYLPKSPAGDVLSINGNSGNASDTGFAG